MMIGSMLVDDFESWKPDVMMLDGRCLMFDCERSVSDVGCPMPDVGCPVPENVAADLFRRLKIHILKDRFNISN
jgi:hypothetical protein